MSMRRLRLIFVTTLSALLALACATSAHAQSGGPAFTLSMRRDFGYGGFGEVQGAMSLRVSGPEELTRVVFFIDCQEMGEATSPPWQLAFHTDSYAEGTHTLSATGYTDNGLASHSNEIRVRFLSAEQAGSATGALVIPLLGGIGALMLLSFGISSLVARRRPQGTAAGTPRNYGLAGGAICPRCDRPFARHLFAPNMITGKLERCPYCGKWAIVSARSPAELAAAQAAELEGAASTPTPGGDSDLRRDLEDSRFQDG